jgi:hypothetical protein
MQCVPLGSRRMLGIDLKFVNGPKLVKTSFHKIEPAHRYRACADEGAYVLSSKLCRSRVPRRNHRHHRSRSKIVLQLQGFGGPFASSTRCSFVTAESDTSSSPVDKIAILSLRNTAISLIPNDARGRDMLRLQGLSFLYHKIVLCEVPSGASSMRVWKHWLLDLNEPSSPRDRQTAAE